MTNDNPPPTPALTLSDKLMAMNHLTTFVPEKLDVDAMNYSSWVYYFSHLCHGYGILDHLVDPVASSSTTTPTDPPPKDAEWTKIDFIIRSWIFSTLAPSLRKRLVDLNPTTAKDAWTYIEAIFQDNKRPRAMALKAELRNLKLGDLSIDGYFQKIESIVSVLNGLGSPLSNDDVVTFALEGLPSTYETISTVIVSREPFPDLKTVRSLLTTHEMRLKSRVQNPLVDATSASPMVLLAKSNTSARRGPSLEKVNNPCWSFAKGSCRFGDACKYLHNGVHGKSTLLPRTSGSASSVPGVTRSDLDMLQSLLAKFGLNAPNISTPSPPVAYTVSVPPGFQSVSAQLSAQPTYVSPQLLPGSFGVSNMGMAGLFPQGVQYPTGSPQQGVHYPQQGVQTLSGPPQGVHLVPGTSQPPQHQFCLRTGFYTATKGVLFPGSGQATLLLNAFNTLPLQEPALGNWNMDTGASSHLNDSVHCLSDILNMCIYPSVTVSDRRFIPVTNSRHSVLSIPFRPLHLNNVLITPNIDFITVKGCSSDVIARVSSILLRSPSLYLMPFLPVSICGTNDLDIQEVKCYIVLCIDWISILVNKEKLPILCHACQLGKHVKLPFVSSSSSVTSYFDIVYSDLWTSLIPSLSGFQYYVLVSKIIHSQVDHAPVHTPLVDVPTPPTPPTRPIPPPPPTPHSVPQIVPEHALAPTNDPPTMSIHPMVTHSRVRTTRPNPHYAGHTSVPQPEGANIVRCMWLFRHKFLADGTLSRYKARLVANGSTQVEGVDVDENFSPIVKPSTIQTVLSLAISRHWPVHQLDVKNAFLHDDLAETVYMHQPPSFWDPEHPDYSDDTTFLLLYVDDIVLTASSDRLLQQIIAFLHREFSMTDLGALNYFLGILVTRDSSGMFLLQHKYAMEILERAHMVGCNSSRTPVDTESKLRDGGTPVVDPTLYQSLAGSLQYLTFTRPDITYALFSSTTDSLIAYSDADWAGCPTTRRSTSGYCVFLGNNLLSWSSKRQPTLSRSSAEAEYRGVANAVAETCWIQNLLPELHTPLSSATIVYCDNVSAVYLSSNPVQHQRTKHIEIDIHFVQDLVATGQVRVLHVPSRFQYADIFTKGLPSALFDEFRDSLSVRSENVIVTGAENRPPMLEEGMYDSWKTRIWIYIKGKENGEMLIDSIINGPFQLKKEITIPGVNGAADEKRAQTVLIPLE
ncbi:ribonuclease H-like domain-containing protein [Tanacetum coccineum]